MKRPEIHVCIIVPPDHIVLLALPHNVTIKEVLSSSLRILSDAQSGGGATKTVERANKNCR